MPQHEAASAKDEEKAQGCKEQWAEVRDKLVQLVLEGNADVARYGDMITDEHACTRFLRGAKGKVDKGMGIVQSSPHVRKVVNRPMRTSPMNQSACLVIVIILLCIKSYIHQKSERFYCVTTVGVTLFLLHSEVLMHAAVDMFKEHLEWRVSYKVENITDEDFSDLKERQELYWGGRDKDGVMTLMWRLR